MSEENALSVEEAGEIIMETLMEEPEPTPEPQPEVQAQPSDNDITQGKLVAYQQACAEEAAAIQAADMHANSLRQSNPAEFAAQKAELLERRNALSQGYANLEHAVKQFDAGVTGKAATAIESERAKLNQMIPGWNKAKAEKLSMHLRKEGYTDQQIANVRDAKTVKLAWNAMKGSKKKSLSKVPRLSKKTKRQSAKAAIERGNFGPTSMSAAAEKILRM